MAVAYLTNDLMFSSRVTAAARDRGIQLDVVSSPDALLEKLASADINLVLLDLNLNGLDIQTLVPQLRAVSDRPVSIIAYASHVHESKLADAKEAGCDEVLSRGQFDNQYGELLDKHQSP